VSLSFGPDDPQRFALQVPPTAVDGTFSASGDGVQLYLRRGEPPTVDSYEHTGRSIALAPLAAGDWHALVVASKPTSGRMNAAVNATPAMRDGRALLLAGTAGSRKVLRFERRPTLAAPASPSPGAKATPTSTCAAARRRPWTSTMESPSGRATTTTSRSTSVAERTMSWSSPPPTTVSRA
jgi:hypothetical protein